MDLSCRKARREDLPAIVAIYNASIPSRLATADTEPVSVAAREPWFHAHVPESRPLWVAEHAGTIVGWLSFSDFYGRPAYWKTAEISLYVAPTARRQGVGSYLLHRAVEHAPALKADTLLGFVFGHNAASLELFRQAGFERWGLLPGIALLDGVERDLVILGRRITGTPAAS